MSQFHHGSSFVIILLLITSCGFLKNEEERKVTISDGWFNNQINYLDTCPGLIRARFSEKKILNQFERFCCEGTDTSRFESIKLAPQDIELNFIGRRYQSLMKNGFQKSIFQELLNNHGWSMCLPSDFSLVKQKEKFAWLRNALKRFDVHLFVYQTDYVSDQQFSTKSIIHLRDSLLKKHFFFRKYDSTSYAQTETFFPVESQPVYWKNSYAEHISGVWKIGGNKTAGKTLGGVFTGYALVNASHPKDFFYVEAFFSAPNKDKLPFIRTLNAILSTFECKKHERRF